MINSNVSYIFALVLSIGVGVWFYCAGEGLAGFWAFISGVWVINAWLRDRSAEKWKQKYHEMEVEARKRKGYHD